MFCSFISDYMFHLFLVKHSFRNRQELSAPSVLAENPAGKSGSSSSPAGTATNFRTLSLKPRKPIGHEAGDRASDRGAGWLKLLVFGTWP